MAEKLPLVEVSNLTCAFCGRHIFLWHPYSLDCAICEGQIHWNDGRNDWEYSYPPTILFMSNAVPGVEYSSEFEGYQHSPIPRFDILTGHRLPDRAQIKKLENELQHHESLMQKIRTRIKELSKGG